MDCEHPPQDAVRKLPEELAQWARLSCFPSGQSLTQGGGTQWRYPSSFTEKVYLPARGAQDDLDGKPRYFTRLAIRKLPNDEARAQHQRLLKSVTVYADRLTDSATNKTPDAPQDAWEVVGTNNANNAVHIYLMRIAGVQDTWGLVCAPECESQAAFLIISYN